MGALLVVVGLLCLCGLSHECRRELQVNVDFPGSDITSLYSPDAEHCQHLCTQEPACLFFTFLRPDWTGDNRQFYCYLKTTPSGEPNVQKPLQGVTSGFSLKSCNPDPNPCLSQVYRNVNFPGADYRTLFTADYEECQRACTRDPGCQFFTFIDKDYATENSRYKCFLKFSWTVPRTPQIRLIATIVSGFSPGIQITQHGNTACEGKLFLNTDSPGFDIQVLPAASPEYCQMLCSAHPLCTYFSYISETFNCYLKNNPNEMVKKPVTGITSGLPARFCQLNNNWIKKTYVGVDFPYYDILSFVTDGIEACQRACTENANCQFYSYITDRRLCYLKRVIAMPAPPNVSKFDNVVSGFSLKNCWNKYNV